MRSRYSFTASPDVEPAGGRWLLIAPLVLIVLVPVADIWLPPDVHIAPLLTVAPTFTAAFAGPRLTAAVGALAVAAQVVAGLERHSLDSEQVVLEVSALVLVSVLLVLFCLLRERHRAQLRRARFISDTAQSAVLRPLPTDVGPLRIATEYQPAESDTRLGGDLFALARTGDSTRLLIGDVRGKGLDSISDTTIMLGAFRAAAHRQASLSELVAYLEGSVRWGLDEVSEAESEFGERFVTAAVLDIPDDEPVLHLVTCGHPPPIVLSDGRATSLLVRRPAPPLGLGGLLGGLGDTAYTAETFPFAYGDQLLLYTDGVSEARDSDGVFYPLAERGAEASRAAVWSAGGPRTLLDHLTKDLLAYAGGRIDDDLAMIAVCRTTKPQPPATSAATEPATEPEAG
ncbi:PP2C family protein-serine/threonine phosphatase [Streptomyces fuscigenes]|uniref:PP2C family protein-serine/threonine phosphatase n=1 Tax=Streptomyces fuscigenes TaxID=1528880 RepID=UPI001F265826|nr:PP2C family protein-serine/threonine phosphatase [Streptomyces fuscigenes]MCF3961925.1 serine/threonine-protein phosphatase [Streptomyces fuscigenes]